MSETNATAPVKAGLYTVDATTREVVPPDPYAGMRATSCNQPIGSPTPPVIAEDGSAVSFSPEALRKLGVIDGNGPLPKGYLFMDSKSGALGNTCIQLEDAQTTVARKNAMDGVKCETTSPLVSDQKACEALKFRISQYTPPKEPGVLAKLADGTIIGSGFAVSAMGLNWLASKLTGKSILDRIRNGNGKPKDPPPPPPAAPSGGGKPVAEAPKTTPVPDGSAPNRFDVVDFEPQLPKPVSNPMDPVQVKAEYGMLAGILVLLVLMASRVVVPATALMGIGITPGATTKQEGDGFSGIGHGVPMA